MRWERSYREMVLRCLKLPFSATESAGMSRIETTGRNGVDSLFACVMTVRRVDLISGGQAARV
jgi:hypothetical protein